MNAESKLEDPQATSEALEQVVKDKITSEDAVADEPDAQSSEEEEDVAADSTTNGDAVAAQAAAKKKRSKRKKIKNALTGAKADEDDSVSSQEKQLSNDQLQQLLEDNPALKAEVQNLDPAKTAELLKKLNMADLLTDMSAGGKNQKDMSSYKFWQTQPVPSFEDQRAKVQEGPIKIIDPDKVPKEPSPLLEGFEWVTMDLTDEEELEEVYQLLGNHYVEDDEAMFRFNYSHSFLNWALKSPGWRKEWHIGVRASQSRKLVAFISGIPVELRVRKQVLQCSEINFLCIHKKLRSKRLAPVLIKEITRRCYAVGVWQAIYTAGVLLPTPVSTCRYFHRSLDWEKLYEVGFSPLPAGSTRQRQVSRYKLPSATSTHELRPMQSKDVDSVLDLLKRYLQRMDMAQMFTRDEVEHWLLHQEKAGADQVVWSYVVEDPENHKITDFFSFYRLESTVIGNQKHRTVNAAYLYYYATERAFADDKAALRTRLNELMRDALILAKRAKFDVFNALTLLDNPLFLEEQKFGAGDGQLHYYLYNYRTAPIMGGVDPKNNADERYMGGVGVVML